MWENFEYFLNSRIVKIKKEVGLLLWFEGGVW